MNRMLTFDDTDQGRSHFNLLYQGFVMGGDQATAPKGIETTYAESKILDKFLMVSAFAKSTDSRPTLNAGQQVVTLTDKEHALIRTYYERVNWLTSAAREVIRTLEWFMGAPEQYE